MVLLAVGHPAGAITALGQVVGEDAVGEDAGAVDAVEGSGAFPFDPGKLGMGSEGFQLAVAEGSDGVAIVAEEGNVAEVVELEQPRTVAAEKLVWTHFLAPQMDDRSGVPVPLRSVQTSNFYISIAVFCCRFLPCSLLVWHRGLEP
jgi:hypothetical protein